MKLVPVYICLACCLSPLSVPLSAQSGSSTLRAPELGTKTYTSRPVVQRIAGTSLWEGGSHTKTEGLNESWHDCFIGYLKSPGNVVPILTLPRLMNDSYVITVKDGVLTVTTRKGKVRVLSVQLKNLSPALLRD